MAMREKTKQDKLMEQSKVDVAVRGLILENEAGKRRERAKAIIAGN